MWNDDENDKLVIDFEHDPVLDELYEELDNCKDWGQRDMIECKINNYIIEKVKWSISGGL